MNDEMISQFIDDELSLEEKIAFVNAVHEDRQVRDEAVSLLLQEELLRSPVFGSLPPARLPAVAPTRIFSRPRLLSFASGMAMAAMLFLGVYLAIPEKQMTAQVAAHRFVIYAPNVSTVGISGTFTDWTVLPLNRLGTSGYWETRVTLPAGEHRFSYIMEGGRRVPDPTVPIQERDDFGGVNSILEVHPNTT